MKRITQFITKYRLHHVLFLLVLFTYQIVQTTYFFPKIGFNLTVLNAFVRLILVSGLIYASNYIISRLLIRTKHLVLYIVTVSILGAAYIIVRNYQDWYIFYRVIGDPDFENPFYFTLDNFAHAVLYIALGASLKFARRFYFQQKQLNEIRLERLGTELKFLKSQMHPHSIFNTINTVYSLIDKKNKDARESLAKFSELLRYQIYESDKERIDISREIVYLRNMVELHRMRQEDNVKIDLHIATNVHGFEIAPLLLSPFVENAFKHVSHWEGLNNYINITVSRHSSQLVLEVNNSYEKDAERNFQSSGIGLKNVRRRLELLYPNRHQLIHESNDHEFSIQLKIEIA